MPADRAHRHQAQPQPPGDRSQALILPCLGRTETDVQKGGKQAITVEDSFSMVHASAGILRPLSSQMKSEPAIVAGLAKATLGNHPVDWDWLIEDYDRIRDLIADVIPGFQDFNARLAAPGGFYLGNKAGRREWNTATGKANFAANALLHDLLPDAVRRQGIKPDLILQTMRSHDQYNTTIYSLDDRYRGVKGQRDVVFVNQADLDRLGVAAGEKVDLVACGTTASSAESAASPRCRSTSRSARPPATTRRPIRWCPWRATARAASRPLPSSSPSRSRRPAPATASPRWLEAFPEMKKAVARRLFSWCDYHCRVKRTFTLSVTAALST